MAKALDDLEAVRQIVGTLQEFDDLDRERILRWAREKLGMVPEQLSFGPGKSLLTLSTAPPEPGKQASAPRDIKSFIAEKDPQNDNQLAAVIAYYYSFVAPPSERKDTLTAQDLIEVCRKADRHRPVRPAQTLVNAYAAGFLDKTERGAYRINSVGENLVAMVLPGKPEADKRTRKRAVKRSTAAKTRLPSKKSSAQKK